MHPQCSVVIHFHYALRLFFVVPISTIPMTVSVLKHNRFTHPFCNKYPEMHISPGVPRFTISPLVLMSLALTWGWTFPTVSTRLMMESAGVVWKETGLVSAGNGCYSSKKSTPKKEPTHAISVRQILQIKLRNQTFHEVYGDRGTSSNSRSRTR